jgi:ABC-type branched-subunit amino acid transport system substrate-binding protein
VRVNKLLILVVVLALLIMGLGLAACGSGNSTETTAAATDTTAASGTATTAAQAGTETTAPPAATGEPVKIGFDEGFTGFMAYDVSLAEKGILTALAMLNNQAAGRPLEYVKVDNGSDPVVAVDKARQLVESDKISFLAGPIFSPAAQAVTDYLAKSSGIPQCSIVGQPSDNLKTANKLAFMPNGLYGSQGYYFGKYCAEQLGYKSANCIHYDDTAAHQLQDGFERGFKEAGGSITSVNYVPMDAVDFSSYLTSLKPADCTLFWIFGNGAVPFVKQYNDYGLKAPLVVPMSNNFSDEQLAELGDLGLGMVACDFYASTLDNPLNKEFIAAYQKLYPNEYPTPQAFGGWQAVMLFAKALEATGGDASPAKTIPAMSTMTLDTPAGKVTMAPYKDAYIGTRDFFILESKDVGDGRITWVPKYTFEQVQLGE